MRPNRLSVWQRPRGAPWSRGRRIHRQALRAFSSCAIVALALALAIGASAAQSASPPPAGGRVEMDLSRNGSGLAVGEPEIAVNPVNASQLFTFWTSFQIPLVIGGPLPANPCGGLVSGDGGLHWHPVQVPVNTVQYTNGCGDGAVAAGPHGTLYAGGINPSFTAITSGGITVGGAGIVVHGQDSVTRSTDWGKTWSPPVETMGSDGKRFALNKSKLASGGAPVDSFDRPFLAVDQSTNTVYASGVNLANRERFVTASTDEARSFGLVYALDSTDYPHATQGGGTIAAAHGALAAAYTATQAPGASCPCVIFETSTDHGSTFARHVVPLVNAATAPGPFLTADPSTKGRFALTVLDSTGTENQVYVTDDSGATWHGPTLVGETPANQRFKPWMSYSPSGQLALVWRTKYSNGSYDVWSAIGHDGGQNGAVFSAPVRVSSATAPYPPGYYGGDDFSFIVADRKYVHVGWGDSRSGATQDWYARIPLTSFGSG
jgi:hypothetical protein